MSRLRTLVEDEGVKLSSLGNLAIILWKRTPTAVRARRVCATFDEIADERGLAVLTILSATSGPPDGQVRRIFDETMRRMGSRIVGNAILIRFGGLLGSLVRAVARTLSVIGRNAFPIETFSTPVEAAEWLHRIQGGSISCEDILYELQHLDADEPLAKPELPSKAEL